MKTVSQFQLKKIQSDFPSEKITSSKSAADFIRQFYFDDIDVFESFFILTLNNSMKTTGFAKISQGGTSSTVVDIKIVAKYAVDSLASHVILAHNHPSGVLTPSQSDIALTTKVKEGLKFLDITVADHVILTADDYYSFADNGIL